MIAQMGLEDAVAKNPPLFKGVNVYNGAVVYEPVAKDLGMPYKALQF